jgi:hypothetical protein
MWLIGSRSHDIERLGEGNTTKITGCIYIRDDELESLASEAMSIKVY